MTVIAELLQAKEPLFDHALKQLELRSGQTGVDVALTAELATKSASAIQKLGLDQDCTAEQLYHALIARVQEHDEHLAQAIGGHEVNNVAEMIPLIVARLEKIDMPRGGFFLKPLVARQMLFKHPPTEIMARLGYDDVTDMLEQENIFEIYLALRFAESPDWLNRFNEGYKKLSRDDFESRDITLVRFDPQKWGDIAAHFIEKKLHNITNSKEIGAIAIMPMTIKTMPGITLKVFPLLLHYYNEIRLYSSFFKLMAAKKNFGDIIATTLIADTAPNLKISQHNQIHWRVIQRYFAKLKNETHPEIFEPHVQPEDLHWRHAESILYEVDPELEFWCDMDYVATLRDGQAVTFNLMDVSLSYSNRIPFNERYLYHFRESLWNEVFARYLGKKILREQILIRLDNDMIEPEELKL